MSRPSRQARGRPFVLGLTGSIGMGKSTVAEMFEARGVPVFDADAEVRRLQGPGAALVEGIERAFPGTTGLDGVDRARLGAAVFGDPAALARLEAIVHPAVRAAREAFLRARGAAPLVVFDVPLLFEKGGVDEVDAVLVVTAPAEVQRARVLARPGMTTQRFEQILALQMPDSEKRRRADHLIDTGTSPAETERAVAKIRELARMVDIVIIEHDMEVVFGMADDIIVMAQGTVLASGSPKEIASNERVREAYLGRPEDEDYVEEAAHA